jgi:hypothetical protein
MVLIVVVVILAVMTMVVPRLVPLRHTCKNTFSCTRPRT